MSIQFLLKFGAKNHCETLLENGLVYMKHIDFFKINHPKDIYDIKEGRYGLEHIKDGILKIRTNENEEWKSIKVPQGKIEEWLDLKDAHVYCLYLVDTETTKQAEYYRFSDEILNEWDHFVLIHNPRLFKERLTEKLNLTKHKYSYGIVEYYNEDENQIRLSLFNKRSKYKYQNEFRFVVRAIETGPIQFEIGSLKDIAEVLSLKDVQGLRFLWP